MTGKMTKRRNNSLHRLWAKVLASIGLMGSAAVEELEKMAGSFYLVLQSIVAGRCKKQNQMSGSQVPNFTSEVTGLRP